MESSEPASLNEPEVPPEKWQVLEARWKTVLGVEAGIESLRLRMEGVRAQMEAAFKHPLTVEEKVHALQADVVQWNKAKNRLHYALPKVREFVHRATWALGVPERKKLDEIFKAYVEPQVPFPELDQVPEQLDNLLKDRQVLSAQGASVDQECKIILADIQSALRTLQTNAAARARQKRESARTKGKHF